MNLLTKGARINRDVWTCLNTVATLREFLFPANHGSLPLPELDDKTREAIESSVRLACDRLDSLLLTLTNQTGEDEIEKAVRERAKIEIEHAKAATEAEKARKNLIDTSTRPSVLFRPTLIQTETGAWVAFYGDPADTTTCVAVAGDTPELAMRAFDAAWTQKTEPPAAAAEPAKKKRGKR